MVQGGGVWCRVVGAGEERCGLILDVDGGTGQCTCTMMHGMKLVVRKVLGVVESI